MGGSGQDQLNGGRRLGTGRAGIAGWTSPAVVLLVLATAGALAQAAAGTAEAEVHQVIEAHYAATASEDLDGLLSLYEFGSAEEREAMADAASLAFASCDTAFDRVVVSDLQFRPDEGTCIATVSAAGTLTRYDGAESFPKAVSAVFLLERKPTGWRILASGRKGRVQLAQRLVQARSSVAQLVADHGPPDPPARTVKDVEIVKKGRPDATKKWEITASGLRYRDVVVGDGVKAAAGRRVRVHYTGWLMNGEEFDSSRRRDEPFTFPLGMGQVIKGWDEGVAGMRVGGRRVLVIPPKLGYGARGAGGAIPPNATLKFDVELLGVQ